MEAIHVDVTISSLDDRLRSWTGRFWVAPGVTDSVVPRNHLEAVGIAPERQRVYELADGRQATMDIGCARIEFLGEFTAGMVVFGAPNSEPTLGTTALESVGVLVDPRTRRLTKLPAVRLKPNRGCAATTDPTTRRVTEADETTMSSDDALGSLVGEAKRLASVNSASDADIEEMAAINDLRMAAESISRRRYIFHSANTTP